MNYKKRYSRLLARMLIVIISFSCILPVSTVHAGEVLLNGDSTGTGHVDGLGTWNDVQSGYRVSIVDASGNVVSNVVDFVFSQRFPTKMGKNFIVYGGAKTEKKNPYFYNAGEAFGNLTMVPIDPVWIGSAHAKGIYKWSNNPEDNVTQSCPLPMINGKNNGDAFISWLTGGAKSLGGGGDKIGDFVSSGGVSQGNAAPSTPSASDRVEEEINSEISGVILCQDLAQNKMRSSAS